MRLRLFSYTVRTGTVAVAFFAAQFICGIHPAGAQSANSTPAAVATPHAADGHPDLTGLWKGTAGGGFYLVTEGNKVQYLQHNQNPDVLDDPNLTKTRALNQVEGQERRAESYKKNPNLMPSYKPELLAKVHELEVHETEMDPAFHCHPSGVPRVGPPRQIVQAPGLLVFLYMSENGAPYRVIPTDGRPHRTDVEPSYMGDSIGHWEGDTLVVDVNRFNDDTWLSNDGWFHSTKMHVVERFTRNGNNLTYQMTVEDPEVLTTSWAKNPATLKLSTDPADMISDATAIEAPCVEVDSQHIVNHDHL